MVYLPRQGEWRVGVGWERAGDDGDDGGRADGPRWSGGHGGRGTRAAGAQGKRDQQQTLREDHVEWRLEQRELVREFH